MVGTDRRCEDQSAYHRRRIKSAGAVESRASTNIPKTREEPVADLRSRQLRPIFGHVPSLRWSPANVAGQLSADEAFPCAREVVKAALRNRQLYPCAQPSERL